MRISSGKFLNFTSYPTLPPNPLPVLRVEGEGRGACKVKKLAARDSHFLFKGFLVKGFGAVLVVVVARHYHHHQNQHQDHQNHHHEDPPYELLGPPYDY